MQPLKLFSKSGNRDTKIEILNSRDESEVVQGPLFTDGQAQIFNIPFHTRDPRSLPCEEGQLSYNDRFPLRAYVPNVGRAKRVFLLVNGFAEGLTAFWDSFGMSLASQGDAAILVPLPHHFCRNTLNNINRYDRVDPYQISGEVLSTYTESLVFGLIGHPEAAAIYNRQAMKDLAFIAQAIKGDKKFADASTRHFIRDYFTPETSVSLVGFSLGGLVALQSFLTNQEIFNACFLVNSGANFQDMNASKVFREYWPQLQIDIVNKTTQSRKTFNFAPRFEQVFLGHERVQLQQDLKENCDRILFLMGGSDPVINLRNILNLDARGVGVALFQIPKLSHFINVNSQPNGGKRWIQYRPMVLNLIKTFDDFALTSQKEEEKALSTA